MSNNANPDPVKKKILFVDDEPMVIKVVESRLRANGYDVITAQSGVEGIGKAEKNQPDLIILDSMMPQMDGQEVCKNLKSKEKTRQIPVVIFTCNLATGIQEQFISAGAIGIIFKPDVKLLVELVKDIFSGKKIEWGNEDGRW